MVFTTAPKFYKFVWDSESEESLSQISNSSDEDSIQEQPLPMNNHNQILEVIRIRYYFYIISKTVIK